MTDRIGFGRSVPLSFDELLPNPEIRKVAAQAKERLQRVCAAL